MDLIDYEAHAFDSEFIPSLLIYYSNLVIGQSDFDFLYKIYIEFYNKKDLYESLLDVFLDSTIAMINNSFALANITRSELDLSSELLNRVLQGKTSILTNSQIHKILRILTISIAQRTSQTINEILEIVSSKSNLNAPLNFDIYSETDKIGLYRYKNKASEFANKTIVLNDTIIKIKSLSLQNDKIYDLFFSKFLQDTLNFQLYFYEAGKYKDFNYYPQRPKQLINSSLETPISIAIYGKFNEYNLYTCLIYTQNTWINKDCNMVTLNSTCIEINLMQLSISK